MCEFFKVFYIGNHVICKERHFYFSIANLDAFYFFSCLIALARTSRTILRVMRKGILVMFLILEGKFLVFHHWVWYWLRACHIWPFLCWGTFLLHLYFMEYFNHKWMLYVIRYFCSMMFILCFVNVTYDIDWFVYAEPSFCP